MCVWVREGAADGGGGRPGGLFGGGEMEKRPRGASPAPQILLLLRMDEGVYVQQWVHQSIKPN